MNLQPMQLLSRRVKFTSAFAVPLLVLYACAVFLIFFRGVVPSYKNGTTSEEFSVDSTIYTEYADTLREGIPNPLVLESLARFPNTLWTPVALSYFLNSPLLELVFNLAVFSLSILILGRSLPISRTHLIFLLVLNATTMTSLLCVNKEILDLLCLALFVYSRTQKKRAFLYLALIIALLNRFEIALVLLAYVLAQSRLNPWKEKRFATILLLLVFLNFAMPIWAAHDLAKRFEEAQSAGVIRALDELQLHYLYILAVIPKIADNLFSALLNPAVWSTPSSWLYINFLDNLAYVALLSLVIARRQFKLRNDLIYLGTMGAVLVAQSMVYQPRYFYFLYVLLCLQASYEGSNGPAIVPSGNLRLELVSA